jgi:glycosyltransferase involved in cell wall biosynthesis
MMRIAYIAPYLDKETMQGGVGRKISTQIRIWKERKHEVRWFALSPDEISSETCTAFQYKAATKLPVLRSISRTISRTKALLHLIAAVRKYQPDLIYMRYGRYIYPAQRLYEIAPVVLELNTDDINEDRQLGLTLYWFNRLTRRFVLKNAAGLIAVTHELAGLPANQGYGLPVRVISNGIDLEQYPMLPPPGNARPVITLIGSPGMTWHGVDKLICLAKKCADLQIHIVGYQRSDIRGNVPSNVQFHGFLDHTGVMEVLMKTDVACGSLALHRKNMQEASPLKVREAAAYGIPVLLGHQDTDLSKLTDECILQIPNTEDNVEAHVEQIRSFAYNMMGKRLNRDALANLIDQGPKEEARLAFFEGIIKEQGAKRLK